jgi:glucose/arabinose dehydrogenase
VKTYSILLIASLLLVMMPTKAQTPVVAFSNAFSTALALPVDIKNAGDGSNRLFIAEQGGRIWIYNGTTLLPTAFLDISTLLSSGGERGLLSLAFHPDYETNRYFFVYYTNLAGDITVARYRTLASDPNLADISSAQVILNIPKPASNHNGGNLLFGPDGYLYFGTGDGGGSGDPFNNGQNGNTLLGKMIRLDVNNFNTPPYYTIPADNPYVSDPNVRDEIWALGLRNPWRWSFDRLNSDMWIADVGQALREEVNYRAAGTTGGINYGWKCYEGLQPFNTAGCQPQSSYVSPIFDYPHNITTGGFSVTGGYVYRGAEFPTLQGYYICADYASGNCWLIKPASAGGWDVTLQPGAPLNISTFGEAEDGTLYAASRATNIIYKVIVNASLPLTLARFSGQARDGHNELSWVTTQEQQLNKFVLAYSETGSGFVPVAETAATNQPAGASYQLIHNGAPHAWYRLETVERSGRVHISPAIRLQNQNSLLRVSAENGQLQIFTGDALFAVQVLDHNGRHLWQEKLKGERGLMRLPLPVLSPGIYTARLLGEDNRWKSLRFFIR